MKKTLLIAAMASAALVSCSKDQVVEVQQDEIKFSVVADNATKAAHVYGTNSLMSSFTVCADYDTDGPENIVYIAGDEMSVDGSGNVTNATDVKRYWPTTVDADNPMTFYAIADGAMDISRNAGNVPTVTNFSIPGTSIIDNVDDSEESAAISIVGGQKDLLYAVQNVTSGGSNVALNFRHALSLIEFRAKCTNSALNVTVTGVKVGNVRHTGNFTFPSGSTSTPVLANGTDPNYEDNEDELGLLATSVGSWSGHADITARHEYVATFPETSVLTDTPTNLTYRNPSATNNVNGSMLLLPQTLDDPWDGYMLSGNISGAYIAVKCTICNNDASNAGTGTQLYSGWAYMPLGAASTPHPTWEPGKKYVYTFDFGTGNGGYKEDGEPVLTPISYTVSVDDFDAFAGGNSDVDME